MIRHLLRRGGDFETLDIPGVRDTPRDGTRDDTGDDTGGSRIRCPKCAWQPGRQHKWTCACLHEWNTFETGGVCPACLQQWRDTQCPRCDTWSPHLAWYVDDSGAGPS
jgi:hypothetical protein